MEYSFFWRLGMTIQAMIFRCRNGMCSNEIDPKVGLFCKSCCESTNLEDSLTFQLPESKCLKYLQKKWDETEETRDYRKNE